MTPNLLKALTIMFTLTACTSSKSNNHLSNAQAPTTEVFAQPEIAADRLPESLMTLPQTEFGGFVLKPGFYEAEFKTYCLQPGTPDPRSGDAYLQQPITGYRKDIVESVLLKSKDRSDIDQKNIQLLLWSTVSGSDFDRLPRSVKLDASKLLTSKQLFELKGGVVGVMKTISSTTGILNANSDIKRLFETSINSYEAYERIAVRNEQSKIVKKGVKADQWYKQKENYYVRYFPESYKKVKIQVYVPDGLLDTDNKSNDEYVVFDPTGQQAIPAFTNAQRLGIGAPVIIDIVRTVIKINKPLPPKKTSEKPKSSKSA